LANRSARFQQKNPEPLDSATNQARKAYKKKKLNINLVHHLWLDLDQERTDQVLHLSIGYLWKQLDYKKKVFKE
jgi:hypothetical protein